VFIPPFGRGKLWLTCIPLSPQGETILAIKTELAVFSICFQLYLFVKLVSLVATTLELRKQLTYLIPTPSAGQTVAKLYSLIAESPAKTPVYFRNFATILKWL
jgi:hypothetical protein